MNLKFRIIRLIRLHSGHIKGCYALHEVLQMEHRAK